MIPGYGGSAHGLLLQLTMPTCTPSTSNGPPANKNGFYEVILCYQRIDNLEIFASIALPESRIYGNNEKRKRKKCRKKM